MKSIFSTGLAAAILMSAFSIHAAVRSHAGRIIVDRPADLPEVAQNPTIAMCLHEDGAGDTVLYLEQNNGRTIAVLDVTDPAAIHAIAQVALNAPTSFDFVENFGDHTALIRYRDGSGYATLDFRRTRRPVLAADPQMTDVTFNESLGQTALLQASATVARATADYPTNYSIIDLSAAAGNVALDTINGVSQRLERPETGTLFLLNPQGLNVIRRTQLEQNYRNEQVQMDHN